QLPPFREHLLRGDLLVGTMITLNAPEVAELLAEVGFDWLFIDAEHGVFEAREIQALLQAAGTATPALVRVAAGTEVPIKKALDVGASGIIVPQVNTAEQAAEVVRLARYAPAGSRGVGVARAHSYGLHLAEYVHTANERVAVIVQAEHIEAVRNIEAIVRVAGIDAVLVGPYDLSASMGKVGQVEDGEVRQAIDRVTAVCRDAGIPLGIFGVSAAAVKPYIDQGYTLIVAGVDTILLGQAARGLVAELKG
ncbi:MAG TPA: aldolase/citrate lyase family protein, partial [Herpetosiphonaceae bacterium]|nr:aldolase/citrate lyase family protein [Herpetosiphonaceae bacterium]